MVEQVTLLKVVTVEPVVVEVEPLKLELMVLMMEMEQTSVVMVVMDYNG